MRENRTGSAAIYYLHPLLAGPLDGWARHFERSSELRFRTVLVAPPFLPGRSGDIFLTADHHRLNPRIDRKDALDALSDAASMAKEHDLELMLDLVIDRIAIDSPSEIRETAYRPAEDPTLPPDPRLPPASRDSAVLQWNAASEALLDWWKSRMEEWLDAGIRGFRCDAPQRVPAWLWRQLIAGVRRRHPETIFIAWIPGVAGEAMRALVPCGFDFATSSSWAWDLRGGWLDEETRRAGEIGRLLTMPELPFGSRLATMGPDPETTCRRALDFAAAYGEAWLMPMGFEFGDQRRLDPIYAHPDDFASLSAKPAIDLRTAVTEANRHLEAMPAGGEPHVISATGAPVAAILREPARPATDGNGGRLILVNTALDRPAPIDVLPMFPGTGAVSPLDGAVAVLNPGEVRVLPLSPEPPVILPNEGIRAVESAIKAPRIAIEAVAPAVEDGRFPVKRILGESVQVSVDIVCDGHDALGGQLLWRPADSPSWNECPLIPSGNDRWTAAFPLQRVGRHVFTIEAWVDIFGSYRQELQKKHAAGLPLDLELQEGSALLARLARRSGNSGLRTVAFQLKTADTARRLDVLLAEETALLMNEPHMRAFHLRHPRHFAVDAERRAAGFASWYELFPRSQSPVAGRHGTFEDVIARLPAIRDMGFDVLYFPPIHPIGEKNRKGRNNALRAEDGDPGSPYAIGGTDGGHREIHPQLGTLEDFQRLRQAAERHGIEIALDFAIQCSPDHPWLRDHPEWFARRADGSIRYAENPPKKYEDIVNVAFYAEGARPSLWLALRDIVRFWCDQGVRIFRVDNPHTKPLPFWEWLIADIRGRDPDVIFLAEAFTRPKLMYRLAKVGFSQSYTYFTWRNSAREIRDYLTELASEEISDFFRPHFFVNTPDINPSFLHHSGRPGFLLRAALAATLSGLWGIYNGYELCEAESLDDREEYRDSEKFQLRHWDWDRPGNIADEISRLNRIRAANPALHSHRGIHFLDCPNDALLCYVKTDAAGSNVLVIAANFDVHAAQESLVDLPPALLGLTGPGLFAVEDLMNGGTESWHTGPHTLRLDPALPFRIWRVLPGDRT